MKRRIPSLISLQAFESAARLGRMTTAATELSVTPSAVSRQVRNLETQLNLKLFEGTKNNPAVTEVGKSLSATLTSSFNQISVAIDRLHKRESNALSVGCYNTFTAKWLLPRMHALANTDPDMEVCLATDHQIDAQYLSKYDVIILAEPVGSVQADEVDRTILFPEWLGPVLSPQLCKQAVIDCADDILKLPLLSTKTRPDAWASWACAVNARCTDSVKKSDYQHYYFTIEAALQGLGVCIAPWHLVFDDIKKKSLIAPLNFRQSNMHYVALTRKNPRPIVQSFCTWLSSQASLFSNHRLPVC
jgi:LysR family transcriptional regulator, glycine cleavage system transcriptional activator